MPPPAESATPEPAPVALAPLPALDREHTVDVIRGFALLGILILNIIAFAYPADSYQSPFTKGSEPYIGKFEGLNAGIWWFAHIFADLKLMTLFSMLFGGGVILMSRNKQGGFAPLYYRRLAFLAAVGFLHGFFLWFGDILLSYALCGAMLYPLRNLAPRWLFLIGFAFFTFGALTTIGFGALMELAPPERRAEMSGSPEKYAATVELVRSGVLGTLQYNAICAAMIQIFVFLMQTAWRVCGLMIIGMALMKLGFFTGRWSTRAYLATMLAGYAVSLALIIPATIDHVREGYPMMLMFTVKGQANYVGSLPMAVAHASALILLVRAGLLRFLTDRLAAVGRMAFTNYLATSVILTFCFYGWGLGLFAKFERPQVYLFVLGVWTLQLIWSPLWLARFRTGPLEWLWRSATHLEWQPLRR